jgi:pyruvate/2-oxoglutarate/acetoin dehydrogenase E1 component
LAEWTYAEAVRAGLADAMRADPAVVLLGEDVGGGGVFGVTRGLREEFGPQRVRNTPISEAAITGCAVGAALVGLRPALEIMFMDFITLALDMLVNQAAKLPDLSGGQLHVPLLVRTQLGALRSAGAQHSQCLEAWLAHVPGLTVLAPFEPADAYAAVRWALATDGPVIVAEHKGLYGRRGPEVSAAARGGAAPSAREALACRVRRPGRDVTVVAYSAMVDRSLEAAEMLATEGVEVEVVDLVALSPWDMDGVLDSVRRTHRLVVVHEAVRRAGLGAEVAAEVAEAGFDDLDAPVARMGAAATALPFSPPLEQAALPSAERIAAVVRKVLR